MLNLMELKKLFKNEASGMDVLTYYYSSTFVGSEYCHYLIRIFYFLKIYSLKVTNQEKALN